MNQEENIDKIKEALQIGEIHFKRMEYAVNKVAPNFPLNAEKYEGLTYDDLSYLDQLIFRFSKLQDSMGNRLFPAVLEGLGEDVEGIPFIDLLTMLEKLDLLENHKQWLKLRETRNRVTHEYPFFTPEIIDGLNLLLDQAKVLTEIWASFKAFITNRFSMI